jgi:hypothetical protein
MTYMGLSFNARGSLKPYQKIVSSIDEVAEIFVTQMPESDTRALIFNNYLDYVAEFRALVSHNFIHWLDGSFISKKLNPNDLDFVALVNYIDYNHKESEIKEIIEKYRQLKLDNYVVRYYPLGHPKHDKTLPALRDWTHLFTHSRPNDANGICPPKGFVEVNYSS